MCEDAHKVFKKEWTGLYAAYLVEYVKEKEMFCPGTTLHAEERGSLGGSEKKILDATDKKDVAGRTRLKCGN